MPRPWTDTPAKRCPTCERVFERPRNVGLILWAKRQFCSKNCRRSPQTPEQRFWSRVNKGGPTQPHMDSPCWIWTGGLTDKGYGWLSLNDGSRAGMLAHRFALSTKGPIPDGLDALHQCDNPPCVRPDHLHAGTHRQNILESVERGRQGKIKGSAVGTSKLTEKTIPRMRAMRVGGMTYTEIGRRVGVSKATARLICLGLTWRHVA